MQELREYVNQRVDGNSGLKTSRYGGPTSVTEDSGRQWSHPRWVRINTLKTSLDEQLATTFAEYTRVNTIDEVLTQVTRGQLLHVDKHIPNLVAISSSTEVSTLPAYRKGLLILQDKASCFPAHLLDPQPNHGDLVDACAAPGNKTTHLAAIVNSRQSQKDQTTIWACERDPGRARILERMITIAGTNKLVALKPGQDFMRICPQKEPWCSVGALLLDPSCSGSGIVGRDETLIFDLPSREAGAAHVSDSKKRKRKEKDTIVTTAPNHEVDEGIAIQEDETAKELQSRLASLSAFQTKLLLHAMSFPQARKITYSTCSVHAEENENVVLSALHSDIARLVGWRILSRGEQIEGLRSWPVRGIVLACKNGSMEDSLAEDVADACIRCEKGTKDGTQGFFVAAFVRDLVDRETSVPEDEWEGFEDD